MKKEFDVKGFVRKAFESGFRISVAIESMGISGTVSCFDSTDFIIERDPDTHYSIDYDSVWDIRAVPVAPETKPKEMTIKEKVRVAFEQEREIEVYTKGVKVLTGYVSSYAPHLITIIGPNEEEKEYVTTQYDAITGIRFVGEPCEERHNYCTPTVYAVKMRELEKQIIHLQDENTELKRLLNEPVATDEAGRDVEADIVMIKAKLEHAKKYDYPVIVDFGSDHKPVKIEQLDEHGVYVVSPEPRPNGTGCLIAYDIIRAVYPQEPEAAEGPEHDIAKERWYVKEWDHGDRHRIQVLRPDTELGLDIPIQVAEMTNKVRADLAAAAPELADMMRDAINYATAKGQSLNVTDSAFNKPIKFLRKLNVPNVAPWYKEDNGSNTVKDFLGPNAIPTSPT